MAKPKQKSSIRFTDEDKFYERRTIAKQLLIAMVARPHEQKLDAIGEQTRHETFAEGAVKYADYLIKALDK